jgi:hypothetical protein
MLRSVHGFTRYICDQTSDTGAIDEEPGALFAVGFAVPEDGRAEFDGWYEDEHIGLLMQVPAGCACAATPCGPDPPGRRGRTWRSTS